MRDRSNRRGFLRDAAGLALIAAAPPVSYGQSVSELLKKRGIVSGGVEGEGVSNAVRGLTTTAETVSEGAYFVFTKEGHIWLQQVTPGFWKGDDYASKSLDQLCIGERAIFDPRDDGKVIYKLHESGDQVNQIDIGTRQGGLINYLSSIPFFSPNGKKVLQGIGNEIKYNTLEGHDPNCTVDGSRPTWINDDEFLFLSLHDELKLYKTQTRNKDTIYTRSCSGYAISPSRRDVVFAQKPSNLHLDNLVSMWNKLGAGEQVPLGVVGLHIQDLSTPNSETDRLCHESIHLSDYDRFAREIGLTEYLDPQFSPDGRIVAFAKAYGKGHKKNKDASLQRMDVIIYDMVNKAPLLITSGRTKEFDTREGLVTWVDSQTLAVSYLDEGKKKITFYNLDRGENNVIKPIESRTIEGYNLSVRR